MKNPVEKITVALFNICLILIAIIAPALFFASSDDFYQLKKTLDVPIPYDEVEEHIHACRKDALSFLENIK